jgi:acetoin utilization protein AcuB
MAQGPTIESVMTPYPYSIDIDAHAGTANTMMAQLKIHHLPVTEGEKLVGVVSGWALKQAAALGLDTSVGGAAKVREVCSKKIHVAAPDELLADVLSHMAEQHVETVLVARHGKLIGIFTFTDACRRYAELLRSPEPHGGKK